MWPSIRRALSVATVVTLAASAAPTALAAQTTFTDFASFVSAVGPYMVDSFDGLDESISGPITRFEDSDFEYNFAAAGDPLGFLVSLQAEPGSSDLWLSEETAGTGITFSGFGSSVRGIGGFFFGTDFGGSVIDTPILLRAEDVHGNFVETALNAASPSAFFGVAFDHQLAFLRLTMSTQDDAFATANDLVLAEGATRVPEPVTAVLLVPGALLFWHRSRRRSSSAASND
jgi:hypothetical protein